VTNTNIGKGVRDKYKDGTSSLILHSLRPRHRIKILPLRKVKKKSQVADTVCNVRRESLMGVTDEKNKKAKINKKYFTTH
jgi:hypothetical protein